MHSHHAILLHAASIAEASLEADIKTQSADVQHVVVDRLSIDDARALVNAASSQPVEREVRVFVIATKHIAPEAQNALLKLFEEPPRRTRFFLVIPSSTVLLPTLRSRLFAQLDNTPTTSAQTENYSTFKSKTLGERLQMIADMTKAKDKQWIEDIVQGAEMDAHGNAKLLSSVLTARSSLGFSGASAKMLLEEIALCL